MNLPEFDPAKHPRGPNGRFTRSFSRRATKAQRKRGGDLAAAFRPAGNPLAGLSGSKDAVRGFTRDHAAVNGALRAGETNGPGVAALDRAMKPLPHDTLLTRMVPLSAFGNVKPQALTGFVVRDAGFFPASTTPPQPQPGSALLRIQAPAGTPAAADPDTGDVVLDRGLDMLVQGVRDTADGTEIALTVLPADGTDAVEAPTVPATDTAAPAVEGTADADYAARLASAPQGADALQAVPSSYYTERGVTDEQVAAIDRYIQGHDWDINSQLREGGDDPQVAGWIAGIDSAMASSQLTSDVSTWRGLRDASLIFGDRLDGDLTGMVWREDAYVSTSVERAVSEGFTSGANLNAPRAAPHPMLMNILAPAGTDAVELSDDRYESEILLGRGLTLRIIADHGVSADGVRRVDVAVIPGG